MAAGPVSQHGLPVANLVVEELKPEPENATDPLLLTKGRTAKDPLLKPELATLIPVQVRNIFPTAYLAELGLYM